MSNVDIVTLGIAAAYTNKVASKLSEDIDDLKANGGGGNGVLIVNLQCDEAGIYTADKTFAEIKAVILAGQFAVLCDTYEEGSNAFYPLSECKPNEIIFAAPNNGLDCMWAYRFTPDGSVENVDLRSEGGGNGM